MAPKDLTPNEKLMDTNGDNKVSRKERKDFNKPGGTASVNMQSKFGISYALISSLEQSTDPDAKAFSQWFNQKYIEYRDNPTGFSDDAFRIEMNDQPWAQKYKSNAIADMDFEVRFPQLYKDEINADVEFLRDQAVNYGATLSDDQLRDLAVQKRRMRMNESQMINALSDYVAFDSGNIKGSAGMAQRNIKSWALKNGLQLTDNMVNDYTRNILRGDTTEDDVLQDLRNTYLVGAFPAWADRIQAGMDPADIAAPYKQRMARMLEMGEDEIDLNDSLLQKAMQGVGADGKPSVTPLYAFDREIREDPRWPQTDNAYEIYTRAGTDLLKTFGFR
jgi:hypothetical protein